MPVRTEITTKGDPQAAVKRFVDRYGLKRVQAVVGPACQRQIQRHLRGLGTNKRGWPSTHFYARAARATTWDPVADGVLERVDMLGMRQRYQGGPIRPVRARSLTIPVDPDAYGKLPSDFGDQLFIIKAKGGGGVSGAAFLARRIGKGKAARVQALFKLSSGVNQQGDPDVMPSAEELLKTARDAILERQ